MVQHKGELFEGAHEAIIDTQTWEETQNKLQSLQPEFQKQPASMNKEVIEHTQHALTPTFTSKTKKAADGSCQKKRYRYYVSQKAIGEGYATSKIKTVKAILLEQSVQQMIAKTLPTLAENITSQDFSPVEIEMKLRGHAVYLSSLGTHESGFSTMICHLAPKIILGTDRIEIQMELESLKNLVSINSEKAYGKLQRLIEQLEINTDIKNAVVTLKAKVNLKFSRGRTELVDSETGKVVTPAQRVENSTLMQVIVQADFWCQQMIDTPTKSLTEILRSHKVKPNYVRRLINAAYLAPEIKKAIFQRTQPPELQAQDLIQKHSMDWQIQKKELGFV